MSYRKCWKCNKLVFMQDLVEVNCPHCGARNMYVPPSMRKGVVKHGSRLPQL